MTVKLSNKYKQLGADGLKRKKPFVAKCSNTSYSRKNFKKKCIKSTTLGYIKFLIKKVKKNFSFCLVGSVTFFIRSIFIR